MVHGPFCYCIQVLVRYQGVKFDIAFKCNFMMVVLLVDSIVLRCYL